MFFVEKNARVGTTSTGSKKYSNLKIDSRALVQADLLEEDEEGSLEYAGESSSMGSFDTLASTNKERIAGREQLIWEGAA